MPIALLHIELTHMNVLSLSTPASCSIKLCKHLLKKLRAVSPVSCIDCIDSIY